MGRCRYFKSVSVFRYTVRYFSKLIRYLLSVFQNIATSVRYFQYFTLRQSATSDVRYAKILLPSQSADLIEDPCPRIAAAGRS